MRYVVLGVWLLGVGAAGAQPAVAPVRKKAATLAELEAAVEALRADVTAAAGAAGDAAAARAAASDLEARVAALAADVAAVKRAGLTAPDQAGVVDRLAARVTALEAALSELKVIAALPPAPAPAAEVAALPAADAIPMADESASKNDVVFLRDPAGRIAMSLRGFMQLRYVVDHEAEPRGRIIASGFNLERLRLTWSAWMWSRRLRVRLQPELGGTASSLRDGFLEYQHCAALWLRGGQFKLPLLRQVLASDESTLFADRALFVAHQHQRDVGVTAGGALLGGKLGYQAAALNGAGQNKVNDNIDLRYTARVTVAPLGPVPRNEGDVKHEPRRLVELSLGGMYDLTPNGDLDGDGKLDDVDGDGRADNASVLALAAGAALRWRGAAVEAEYLRRREDEGAGRERRTLHGWFVQGSYNWRGVVSGARMGLEQPSPLGLGQSERSALPEQRWEVSLLAGFARAGHPLRVNGEFTSLVEQAPGRPDRKLSRGLVQVQVSY